MAMDLEEQKKAILPFMQRAQEIQQADPKVAYYCRMYGVEQALKIPQRAKEINSLLGAALSQLEREKAKLDLDPAADRIHCLGFALRIFDNADRVDRAGKATERTSKAFYAASVFIEILNHFEGGVDADLLEKQRYCAWRAAEIRKAIREGRQPTPPPAAEPSPTPTASSGELPPLPGLPGAGGGLADLPPASGSNDWAYGGSGSRAAVTPPPPLAGVGSGGSSFSGGSAPGRGSFTAPPPGPPSLPSYSSFSALPPPPPVPAVSGGAAEAPRFWPGARMLIRTDEGLEDGVGADHGDQAVVVGTVGQIIRRPDGGFSYKVALTDRLVEVPDEAAVPALEEGGLACLHTARLPPGPGAAAVAGMAGGLPAVPVRVLLINAASWPPSYLVQAPNGKELEATAQQLAPPPSQRGEGAPAGAPPPPPPPPPQVQDTDRALGPDYGASAPSAPQPPSYPHPHMPPPPPPASPPLPPPVSPYPAPAHAPPPPPLPPPPQQPSHGSAQPAYTTQQRPSPAATAAAAGGGGWGAAAPQAAPVVVAPPTLPPGYKPPLQTITEAQKQAKYAVSALSFEDVYTAVKHLSEALRLLTTPGAVPAPHGAAAAAGSMRR